MRLARAAMAPLLRVALGLWVVLFVGFLGGTIPQTDPTIRVVAEVVGVLPVAVWALFRLRGPRFAIDVAILLALTAHAIVSLTSVDRTGSLDALGMSLAIALLFWLMRDVALGELSQRMVALAAMIGVTPWLIATAVAWIIEKVDWVRAGGGIPNLESYQVFIWGTANVFPVLWLLTIGFATWLPAGSARRSALAVLFMASVIVVPFSAGRAGWLAILVALAALEVLSNWPLSRAVARRLHIEPRTLFAGTAVAVALVLALFAIRYGGDPANGFLSRLLLWGEALAIFVSAPLTGAGPSTFSWVRLQHAPDFVDRPAVILTHNVPFQTLADGGVILALGLVTVLVAWLVIVWRGRGSLSGRQRVAAAIVMGVAASQLLDDFSFLPAVTAMLVTLGAWALPQTPLPLARRGRFVTPLMVLLLAALALSAVVEVADARLAAGEARSAAVRGDWSAAIAGFENAVLAHPADAGYYLGLAFSLAEAHQSARAQAAYATARQLSPGDPRGAGGLAALTNDPVTRRTLLAEAARHSNDPQYAYRLALDLAEDDPAGATRWMAHAVVLEPQLVGLIGKYAPKIGVDRVIAEVPSVASATGSIKGEDPQIAVWNAGLYAQQLPPTAPASWQAIAAAAAGRLDAAGTALSRAKDDEPYLARTYQAAMAVDLFRCDAAAYQRDRVLEELGANSYAAPTNAVKVDFRDGVYREPGLGDYQPSNAARLPVVPRWPMALVDVPACESIP